MSGKGFCKIWTTTWFWLDLETVTNILPIYAAAGRGQYANAFRLYLEQTAAYEVQHGVLLKTFKVVGVVGLHTVRYTDLEWSGIWTDLSIEQQLMKAAKSSGGLSGGRMRTQNSPNKLWTATLNQMALINQSIDGAFCDWSVAKNRKAIKSCSSSRSHQICCAEKYWKI